MTALAPVSPFDAIRLEDLTGEFWSARDLMTPLGYDRWDNFAEAVTRAEFSINASGQQAPDHIRATTKMVQIGSGAERATIDYRLTRFGAYMVAMNGDPRKRQIAEAQTYFAVKTREAEVRPLALPSKLQLAQMVIEAETAREIAEAKILELEPRAEVADRLLNADGDLSVADTAKVLTRAGVKTGAEKLFGDLARRGWTYRAAGDNRWRPYQSAINSGFMSVIAQSHYHPRTGVLVLDAPQCRVTPKGLQKLLTEYGALVCT